MKADIRLAGRKSARLVLAVGLPVIRIIVLAVAGAATARTVPVLSWKLGTVQLLGSQG